MPIKDTIVLEHVKAFLQNPQYKFPPGVRVAWDALDDPEKERYYRIAKEQLRPKNKLESFFYELLPTMTKLLDEDGNAINVNSWEYGGEDACVVLFFEGRKKHVKMLLDAITSTAEKIMAEDGGFGRLEVRDPESPRLP